LKSSAPLPSKSPEDDGEERSGNATPADLAAQDEDGWSVKCRKFMMIGVALLVLVAWVGVVVMFVKQDDPVTTSTSSTAIMTSTSSTAIMTSTASTAILTSTTSTAITTSVSSTSSTITPEMIDVSEKMTYFMLVAFFRWRLTSHAFIF
jgi:hypothetical protein